MNGVLRLLRLKKSTALIFIIIPLMLLLVLAFNVFAANVEIPSQQIDENATEFSVPVEIDNASSVSGFQVEIAYDANILKIDSTTIGNAVSRWLTSTSDKDGVIKLIGASMGAPLTSERTVLFYINFKIIDYSWSSTPLHFNKVILSDDSGNALDCTYKDTIIYKGQKPNTKPTAVIQANSKNVKVGDSVTLNGSQSSDADNDTLTYSWSILSKPAGSSASLSSSDSQSVSFVPDAVGTYAIQLVVNDSKENSDPVTVEIEVQEKEIQNTKPTAVITANNDNVTIGTMVTIDGSESYDADNDSLSYSWSLLSKPEGSNITITNTNSSQISFTPDVVGTYTIQLTVSDSKDSDSKSITISAGQQTANTKPTAVIQANSKNVKVGDSVTLNGSQSSDADNDTLTYSWSILSKPAGSSASLSSSDSQSVSFVPDAVGTYAIQLVVNDSKENSDPVTVEIIAKNKWSSPILQPKQPTINKLKPINNTNIQVPKPKNNFTPLTPKPTDNATQYYKPILKPISIYEWIQRFFGK